MSGGLDSSLIAAIALQTPSPYKTPITIKFSPQPVEDEKYAKLLEDVLDTPFEWVTISDSDARQALREVVIYIDEPLENPIHIGTYLMAKRARELGVKSVLTGDGSDEFFLGYQRIGCWLNGSAGDRNAAYLKLLPTMKREQAIELYKEEAAILMRPIIDSFDRSVESFENIDQVLLFERLDHLSEDHNMRVDRMTMAHGVEARVPFEDHRLVEFALHMPITTLFGSSGKEWLGQAARLWVPSEIINRKKMHFPSLPDQWFRGEGTKWAYEVLLDQDARTRAWIKPDVLGRYLDEHKNQEANHGRLLWGLMVLELWLQNLPAWREARMCV
ncbi:asparagine synthase C-terminal domain-containing protein [Candidatus Daviesbacteria bacterium]|nr:asparagine synthase C-terminal domain-containing protein [Candidatus Daviesbacteria bacterium]